MDKFQNSIKPLDYRALIAYAPTPMLILQPDAPRFTIIEVSNAYLFATMTQRMDILGKGLFDVFPDNPSDPSASGTKNLRASLDYVLKSRKAHTMAVQKYDIKKPKSEGGDFEERYWSPINVPVFDSSGEIIHIIHRVEDVTEFIHLKKDKAEQYKLTEELKALTSEMEMEIYNRAQEIHSINKKLSEANEKLGELDKLKTKFFSNISHEFRTPLTLMLGPLNEIISDTHNLIPNPHQSKFDLIIKNCLRLQKLVNNLLDFSRLDAGQLEPKFQATEIGSFTRAVASDFSAIMEKTGLSLKIACPDLKFAVTVDREMWEKILSNLLSNALKYTMEGEVEVSLKEDENTIHLKVRDTGVGIPEEEMVHLFHRFHRIQGTKSRIQEGTGLGLTIVKEYVNLHHGKILVESQVGTGSTFTVMIPKGSSHLPNEKIELQPLPIEKSDYPNKLYADALWHINQEPTNYYKQNQSGPLVNKKLVELILYVDDNKDMQHYLGLLLSQVDTWEIIFANNGIEALEFIQQRIPDIILSDIIMPEMNGLQLLRNIRASDVTKHIPFILLTARAGNETKIEGLVEGADDYLIKPFFSNELIARLKTHLKLNRMRRKIAEQHQKELFDLEIAKKSEEYATHLKHAYEEIEAKVAFRNIEALKTIKRLEMEINMIKRTKPL